MNAMGLEDPRLIYTFNHMSVDRKLLQKLIGEHAWKAIFQDATITGETALPFQLRQIIAHQLRALGARMQTEDIKNTREEALKSVATQKQAIYEHTNAMRTAGKRARLDDTSMTE